MARRAGLPLVIAGMVHDMGYFREEVQPRLGEQLTYAGPVGPDVRHALLGGAKALLYLISFAERSPGRREAMATGTPVIVFPLGSMPELVLEGVIGYLVHDVEAAVAAVHRIGGLNRRDCRLHVEERFSAERTVAD